MKLCRTGKASWYKVILIMLLWSALLAVANPALAADKTPPVAFKSHFSDVPSTDANAIYVNFLIGRGIITGYPDGGYHPEEGLTRAQAATVIVKTAGLSVDPNITNPFSDVSEDHWAQAYIAKAAQAKYISGMSDGSYHPDEKLTRAQAISLILRLSQQPLGGAELPATVTDIDSTHWAAPSVAVGIASGMVGLSADGKQYLPDSDFTRISLAHALGVLLTQDPGLYTTSMEGKLKTVEGSVTIQSAGSKSEIEVKTESAVKAGDIIKTGAKSSAELNYPDGSSMLLKENTQITVVESIGRKYLKIDGNEGTAVDWLDIKLKQGTMLGGLATKHETTKTENPVTNKTTGQVYRMGSQLIASMGGWELLAAESQQPPWYVASQQKKVKVKVDMPWGVAAVRGTFVAITVTPTGQSTVSCLTGDAEVTNGGTTVPLSGNQSTQVTQAAAPPPPPAPLPPAELQQFIQAQTWMAQTAQNMTQNQEVTAPPPPAMSGQTPPPASSVTPPAPTPSVQEIISQAVQTATSNSDSAPTSVTNSSDENNTTSKVPISAINNITGTAEVGVELTAGTLTPAGATVIYQWKICEIVDGTYTDINGATTNKYTPVPGDTGKYIKVVASGTGRYTGTVTSSATAAVAVAASADATLKESSTVKGQTLAGLGTPNATLGSEAAGSVTITAAKAADTTNLTTFITLFDPTDATAALTKVVKYASGASTAGFAEDTAYNNEAITNNDFFIVKVTAADSSVLYYKIIVAVTPAPSSDATLKESSTVKGQTLDLAGLGTPNATLGSEVAGSVTITAAKAADTTNLTTFITLFEPNNATAALTKVVKYVSGAPTAGFAEDTAYNNEAITNNDFFIVKVTAADSSVLFYKITVTVTPASINIPNDILAGGTITAGITFGSGTVTILFTDNTTTNYDVLHIYGLDNDIVTNTTGFTGNVTGGAAYVACGAGWAVGDNHGTPKTITITFTDGSCHTSGSINFILQGAGGGNLN